MLSQIIAEGQPFVPDFATRLGHMHNRLTLLWMGPAQPNVRGPLTFQNVTRLLQKLCHASDFGYTDQHVHYIFGPNMTDGRTSDMFNFRPRKNASNLQAVALKACGPLAGVGRNQFHRCLD